MEHYLPKRIDEFFRRHPGAMLVCAFVLAIAATFALLAAGQNRLVYEGF